MNVAYGQHEIFSDHIDEELRFFSYKHFYVMYTKFDELDTDHDKELSLEDLERYSNYALSPRAAQRVFERLRRSLGQVAALCRSPVLRSGSAIRGDLEHVAVDRDEAVAQAVPEAVRAYNLFWAAQIDGHLAPVTARLLGARVLVSV